MYWKISDCDGKTLFFSGTYKQYLAHEEEYGDWVEKISEQEYFEAVEGNIDYES